SLNLNDLSLPSGWEKSSHNTLGVEHVIIKSNGSDSPLAVKIPKSGSYRIHLGLYRVKDCANSMQVKTTSGRFWIRVLPMSLLSDRGGNLQNADLGVYEFKDGDDLLIRTEFDWAAAIAYVVLEEEKFQPHQAGGKNVGVVLDMAEVMGIPRIDEPDDLLALVEPYGESDFTHLFWGNAAGSYNPLYFSKVLGYQGESDRQLNSRPGKGFDHRVHAARAMRMFKEHGKDPLACVIEHAHSLGKQLWSNDRISKNHEHDLQDDTTGGKFLLKHKDKRVYNLDGQPYFQFTYSFAYPEIREKKIEFLAEQAEMGVDGIFLDFKRKSPVVGGEQIVQDEYNKKYNTNIKDEYENKPRSEWIYRWLHHQTSYVTNFMRNLRARLDEIGKRQNRYIPIAAQILGGWHLSLGFTQSMMEAVDFETWAKEGLVDFVAPVETDCLWHEITPFERINQLIAGTKCKVWGSIGSFVNQLYPSPEEKKRYLNSAYDRRYINPERIARAAYDFFNQGADGVFIWEGEDTACIPARWNIIKNIGNMEKLREKFGKPLCSFDGKECIDQVSVEQ
ncbi:MAG: glycoside hydrolase family 10 protein, partial [Planctomycetota bacterium]